VVLVVVVVLSQTQKQVRAALEGRELLTKALQVATVAVLAGPRVAAVEPVNLEAMAVAVEPVASEVTALLQLSPEVP
jgi:hypothetical protein